MKMKLNRLSILVVCSFTLVSCADSGQEDYYPGTQRLDIEKIASRNAGIAALEPGTGFERQVLKVTPNSDMQRVAVWEKGDAGSWEEARYLIIEIYGLNDYSGRIAIEFYREDRSVSSVDLQSGSVHHEDNPRLLSLQGISPRLKTKMVFPLSYLDAQHIFLPRFPRQLKGTVSGNRLDPAEITQVMLRFGPHMEPHFTPEFEVAAVYMSSSLPEPYPPVGETMVDMMGQGKHKDWEGKIHSEEELIERSRALMESVQSTRFPEEWSKYGGWKEKKFESTGYFRTQHDGDRWWLVDPEGFAFLSAGVTGIGHNASGPVEGIEDLFDWLPDSGDARFAAAVGQSRGMKTVDFLRANLIRAFGDDWEESWSGLTAGLMRKFKLNTVANWSDMDFIRTHNLPYVLQLRNFPSTENLLYRDFPDVFSAEYAENSVDFARQLTRVSDDPYLIGYFLINEPHWGFGYQNLAFEMFASPRPSSTKEAFAAWIEDKYEGDISGLNSQWNLSLSGFDALSGQVFREYPSETAEEEFHEFSRIMVRKYVDVVCDEVEKVDPNHMNLGMRYAWISSDLMYSAGERFDVFSINGYGNPGPPPTEEIARRSGKPVMIGEWHFGATDRGLPATGIQGALNQEQRGVAYRYYVEQGFSRPELIGMHYFQWNDQPVSGRFDGENYNIGIVDINNQPYPELTRAMIQTHERMYGVASGSLEPFGEIIERVPSIHY
ncbi:MAG: hypothetical protein WDZ53_00285 [Balneolales bacterium]